MPQMTTTALIAFSSMMSLGTLCAPEQPPQPPPQEDLSGTYRKMFAQQYTLTDPTIKSMLGKIEMEEASYQDWHARTDDKGQKLAIYGIVTKKHDELVTRTAAVKADYEAWVAFYAANKDIVSTHDECREFSDAGQAVRKAVDDIYLDYVAIRPQMLQIAR